MEHKERLVKLILNNEGRKAEMLLSEISKTASNEKYADAREKILLIETAKTLNESLPSFYIDVKTLTERLFEKHMSVKECVSRLCSGVKDSASIERQDLYAKAISFIEGNLTDNQLAVGSVAEYIGLTQSELIKIFKEKKGITPGDYIGKKRAEESLAYLAKNTSVEKAAYAVGFSSVEAYIRTFSKHIGITPGVWKKKNL